MSANIIDPRFGPAINETELVVPQYYNHGTWLATFAEKTKGLPDTYRYNDNLTDNHFSKSSNKLIPGKKYKATFFHILENNVFVEDCMAFLKGKNAILVGAQGLLLAQYLIKNSFPVDKIIGSLDKEYALWTNLGCVWMPVVMRNQDGNWHFDICVVSNDRLRNNACLFCLCEI